MKTIALIVLITLGIFCVPSSRAQLVPDECTNCVYLTSWYFPDTNWLSDDGYSPVGFSNLVNIPNSCDGNGMLLDTTNATPAFLFYNIVQTNSDSTTFTNITPQSGTFYVWLNPTWSSSNASGTGPGDWANIISMGQAGTNGTPWFAWYISPDGNTVYLGSQTNGGTPSVYLSAPVSFLATNWYNLTLTWGPTNCAFYTNGVLVTNGVGVTNLPGPSVTFFAIGSDTSGYHQARAQFSDLETFNYQLDSGLVWGSFSIITPCYGITNAMGDGGIAHVIVGAPFTNSVVPTFDAVTGPGFLQANGTNFFPSNGTPWITNYSAAIVSSNVVNLNFAVAGGTNGVPYDVFATAAFADPVTNTAWYWMGQAYRGTNYILPVTNYPPQNAFIILGIPWDGDHDGLTDAYELLVSHSDPNKPDSSGDGMLDGWKIMWGLNPNTNNAAQPSQRANYTFDPASRLKQVTGVRVETNGFDGEGNILSTQ